MVFNSDYQLLKKLKAYKLLLIASLFFLGLFTFWQGYSALKIHERYQSTLMERVVDRVNSEYKLFLSRRQLELNKFQRTHAVELHKLYDAANNADKESYMALLNVLKQEVPYVRLFSLISPQQIGTVSHITGDFLPDCKEEIASTFLHRNQEELFLHRSSKSIHFDLLIPLIERPGAFLFVAFNVDELQALLNRHSLPHQELFLLRNDQLGVVELTNIATLDKVLNSLEMNESQIRAFSFSKPIENTRWQIAIKLADTYKKEILFSSLVRVLLITVMFSGVLWLLYRVVSRSTDQLMQAKDYIYKQQSFDALTGAYTKYKFIKSFNSAFLKKRLKKKFSISFQVVSAADIAHQDDEINQADFYLKQLTNALMALLGEHYTYGRISDGVVAVYSELLSEQKANDLCEKLDHLLIQQGGDSSQRFSVKVVALELGQGLQSGIQLVKAHLGCQRDIKVYSGQKLTGSCSQIQAILAEEYMFNILLTAIEQQDVVLYLQQIHALSHKAQAPHYEVLVRLENQGRIISPNEFIPLAEQSGHIIALDKVVIRKTLEKMSLTAAVINCSINLSGKTITDSSLPDFIRSCFEEYHVSPKHITFEITETDAINDFLSAQQFIDWATGIGCQFALDDFGKGLSSFSYLQQLKINKLKIDGSFITDLDTNAQNQMFVKTMVSLAHNMGLQCVAECAENSQTVDKLKTLGVDYVQGFVLHKPEPWQL